MSSKPVDSSKPITMGTADTQQKKKVTINPIPFIFNPSFSISNTAQRLVDKSINQKPKIEVLESPKNKHSEKEEEQPSFEEARWKFMQENEKINSNKSVHEVAEEAWTDYDFQKHGSLDQILDQTFKSLNQGNQQIKGPSKDPSQTLPPEVTNNPLFQLYSMKKEDYVKVAYELGQKTFEKVSSFVMNQFVPFVKQTAYPYVKEQSIVLYNQIISDGVVPAYAPAPTYNKNDILKLNINNKGSVEVSKRFITEKGQEKPALLIEVKGIKSIEELEVIEDIKVAKYLQFIDCDDDFFRNDESLGEIIQKKYPNIKHIGIKYETASDKQLFAIVRHFAKSDLIKKITILKGEVSDMGIYYMSKDLTSLEDVDLQNLNFSKNCLYYMYKSPSLKTARLTHCFEALPDETGTKPFRFKE